MGLPLKPASNSHLMKFRSDTWSLQTLGLQSNRLHKEMRSLKTKHTNTLQWFVIFIYRNAHKLTSLDSMCDNMLLYTLFVQFKVNQIFTFKSI